MLYQDFCPDISLCKIFQTHKSLFRDGESFYQIPGSLRWPFKFIVGFCSLLHFTFPKDSLFILSINIYWIASMWSVQSQVSKRQEQFHSCLFSQKIQIKGREKHRNNCKIHVFTSVWKQRGRAPTLFCIEVGHGSFLGEISYEWSF